MLVPQFDMTIIPVLLVAINQITMVPHLSAALRGCGYRKIGVGGRG
jgi:hypothetical protein